MTTPGRWVLVAVAAVLLVVGLVSGLAERDYSNYPDRVSCGSVLAPTTFIVLDADDPLLDETARCSALIGRSAPQVWTMLGAGGVLLVVAAASLLGRGRVDESERGRPRS